MPVIHLHGASPMRRCFEGCFEERPKKRSRSRSPKSSQDTLKGSQEEHRKLLSCESGSFTSVPNHAPELHVLYASPLDERMSQINIHAELELLGAALKQAQCDLRVSVGVATANTLAQLLTHARDCARVGGHIILHLSAHVVSEKEGEGGTSLVLEDGTGGAHVLHRSQLEELLGIGQQLDGLPLVFLNSCWSENMAQLFVEAGCRHVIATRGQVPDAAARAFSHQFYFALASHQPVLTAWENALQVLRIDPNPKLRGSAELFVLFGQRLARTVTLWSLDGLGGAGTCQQPASKTRSGQFQLLGSSTLLDAFKCDLPPHVEDFIGRVQLLREIMSHTSSLGMRAGRRACVVAGVEGVGKSALAIELAHYASAPGRHFSHRVVLVQLNGDHSVESCLQAVADSVEAIFPVASPGDSSIPDLSPISSPISSTSSFGFGMQSQCATDQLLRVLRLFNQHKESPVLLIVDDGSGIVKGSSGVWNVLGELLKAVHRLCIAIFSREHIYESLSSCKCVNLEVPPLSGLESAQLFLRRIHRPLRPRDLVQGATGQEALTRKEEILERLAAHPLLRLMGGNPGRIRDMSQRVTPEVGSLFDLCDGCTGGSSLLRRMTTIPSPEK